jgi:acetyl-CoA synthetase
MEPRASSTRATPPIPTGDRHWEIVERYKVSSYYTAPTLIRSFVKMGEDYPARHDLSSLRLLGTVGEPINPEAWVWYWKVIGPGALPGRRHVVADGDRRHPHQSAPGVTTLKPGSATVPFPGSSRRSSTSRATRSPRARAASSP